MTILFDLFRISYNSNSGKPTIFEKTKSGWKNVLSAETPEDLSNLFIEKYNSKVKPFSDLDYKKFNYMKGAIKKMPKLAESTISRLIDKIITEEIRKIKEGSQQEIESIAIDLIDYLGAQLPPQIPNRALDFFRELGYKDNDPMVRKIYQVALKMNRG